VGSEVELLERFVQLVEEYKPDMITGYYSDAFDLPFIAARAEKYRIELNPGLDYSPIKVNRKQSVFSGITGIAHFDVLRFVKKVFGRSLKTTAYDLNSVAVEVLDERKDDVDLSRLYAAWESNTDLEAFCKYNLQDAVLTLKLAEKLLPNVVELVKVVRLAIDDVSRMSFSQLVEWFMIKEAKNFNELVPNRPAYVESRQRFESTYEGAYVYEPTPGLYRDITVFDFRSLYPTIISAHNISPDTINCDCCIEEDLVPQPGSRTWFCRKRKGFISTVIEGIITRRLRIKEIMKTAGENRMLKAREEALKTIANSMYGYLGFFGARWYSVECARSITAYGRHYIMSVIEKAKKDFSVLYSDTDSIFISLGGRTRHDAERFANDINSSLPGLMELEYEGFYPAGIFVAVKARGYGAKKKYALLTEDGGIKIRGFETVRRNLSLISKEVQEKVIGMLLKGHEPEKAAEYVKGVIEMLRAKSAPVEKLVIKTQLQKEVGSYDSIAPHVAVAKRMRQQGKDVGIGATISYVVVEGEDKISGRAKMPEEVKEGEYDAEYYIHNQIIPSVGKIFEIFGINIIEFIEPKLQKKLDAFFG
ncbi:ribonuclease H-like domain-containing protein, partial [Candidatus Woesearchaeota archaeon]|nr:ribonuclease H-like domain-containing protein [Candidatus Woesearchaeota archaeon]